MAAVVTSAFAIGFLVVPFVVNVTRPYLRLCAAVLAVQAAIGVVGFIVHVAAMARQPVAPWFEKVLNGLPPMAPLLFPNLVVLAAIALWVLDGRMTGSRAHRNL